MKRILLMLAVAAFMVAALTVTAAMSFAAPNPCSPGEPGCNEKKQERNISPSNGQNAGGETPFTQTTTTSGKGNSAENAGTKNPHTVIVQGPTLNRGGNAPGGQQA